MPVGAGRGATLGVQEQPTRNAPTEASKGRHLGGAALGLGFAAVIEAITVVEPQLRGVVEREFTMWPIFAIVGMYAALGAVTSVAVLLAPRLPWLPTTAAATLGYGMFASLTPTLAARLPHPGRGLPRADWGLSTLALLTGTMLVAAAWGWWSFRRKDADAAGLTSHDVQR
jgi:hypothetical protein